MEFTLSVGYVATSPKGRGLVFVPLDDDVIDFYERREKNPRPTNWIKLGTLIV